MGGVVDSINSSIDAVVDLGKAGIDLVENVVKLDFDAAVDSAKDVGHAFVDLHYHTTDIILGSTDFAFEQFGVKGATQFLEDANLGVAYIGHGVVEGDKDSIIAAAILVVSIIITIYTWNPYALVNSIGSVVALSEAAAMGLIVAGYAVAVAAAIYSVYNVLLPLAMIGEALRKGAAGSAALFKVAQEVRDALNLSFVTAWANGSMSRWMPGGVLYDAPRAGDVLFNPTGAQHTTKFLGVQDSNINFYAQVQLLGYYHTPYKMQQGALAGDEGFSVSSMVAT